MVYYNLPYIAICPVVMQLFYFSGSTLPSRHANAVHVMKMCQAFARGGVSKVTLFGKKGFNFKKRNPFKYYGVKPIFDLCLSPYLPIPVLGGVCRILNTVFRTLVSKNIDVIYGRDFWTLALMSGFATPIICELHEMPQGFVWKTLFRRITKAPNFAGLVVISEELQNDVVHTYPYIEQDRMIVAHDGADVYDDPIVPAQLNISTEDKKIKSHVGYAGSLYQGKGVELILKIAAKKQNSVFHVFGGSESQIKSLQQREPISGNIRFYGHIPHGDLPRYLAACDILCAPYQNRVHIDTGKDIARWLSPLKLFEYMASERPILCSDLKVLREIICNEHNGILLSPNNVNDWVEAINRLEASPERVHFMVENAYSILKTKYAWSVRSRYLTRIIKNWIL